MLKKFMEMRYNNLLETLNKNDINYIHFKASDPSTWLKVAILFITLGKC